MRTVGAVRLTRSTGRLGTPPGRGGRTWRGPVVAGALVIIAAAAVLTLAGRLPSGAALQDWTASARRLGVALPVIFVLVHAVVTTVPFPRTVFTLAAGVLFGPALGIPLALAGATASAMLALLGVRALGRDAVAARLQHRTMRAVNERLRQRGWLAVASLRLIPAVPFWLINYACGVSAVRVLPFALATVVAMVPGTTAVVLLGDVVTGRSSPLLLGVSVVCGAVGLVGMLLDARTPVSRPVKV